MRIIVLVLLAVFAYSATVPFVDFWHEINSTECLAKEVKHVCLRVSARTGVIDPNFAKNVKHIADSGLKIDISAYIQPCVKCDIKKQTADVIAALKELKLKSLWITVEGEWGSDRVKNSKFLHEYIAALTAAGLHAGIQTDHIHWMRIMGREHSEFSHLLLWNINHDRKPDGGFTPFGGWRRATAKQYQGGVSLCAITVSKDSYFE